MPPKEWANVRRILVIRTDNIGDVVMTGPALRVLRRALPQAHITMLLSPAGGQIAPLLPWIDDVILERVLWQDASGRLPMDPAREWRLIARLRTLQFDAAVVLTSFSQSPYPPAYACYLAGIPLRAGQSPVFGGAVLTHWVKPLPEPEHQADRNLHLLTSIGFESCGRELELRLTPQIQYAADRLLNKIGLAPGAPFIAIAPGASCEARRYDPLGFAAVAERLGRESALPVVLLGSEAEVPLVQAIVARARNGAVHSLAGATTVAELAGIIGRAALLLANHSGPMHIADALRRPMVVLFSGTDLMQQWRPRNAPWFLLQRRTTCAPCYGFDCMRHKECLDIAPDEVVRAGLSLLSKNPCSGFAESVRSCSGG